MLFLLRTTFVSCVAPESPRLPDDHSALSSYTPNHSMAFSKWPGQMLEPAPNEVKPTHAQPCQSQGPLRLMQ
ncbi:hypothetical protein PAL_GLEAN10016878 [Pteropus alecto]|uniref:Uncharacterized protein n=1 Tax=Pteropus alecto TaxID=9402 RepID=L5JUD6_PTEAL|nr:hypothetical protein PAL_GLEAN10016878 [Pteropus alecto]